MIFLKYTPRKLGYEVLMNKSHVGWVDSMDKGSSFILEKLGYEAGTHKVIFKDISPSLYGVRDIVKMNRGGTKMQIA